MIALPHRRHAEPPALPRRCDSGAMFEVIENDGTRTFTCATCFPLLLKSIRLLDLAVYREVEPTPGRCECLREVSR